MALFERKREYASGAPLYSLGSHRTVLIIGLGNPGKQHTGTRHNIGFAALDDFAERNDFPGWVNKKDLKSLVNSQTLGDSKVILAKPTTFMNDSGEAALALQHFYRIYNSSTIVIYDELAIKFGQLRARVGGSDAGHNGVKSLIAQIGDNFGRIRVGIGNEFSAKADAADFVLGKFTKEEKGSLPTVIKEAGVMLTEYIYSGELPHETRSIELS
jgi:peptidyl-tRNA hydrolase, PTH1 family